MKKRLFVLIVMIAIALIGMSSSDLVIAASKTQLDISNGDIVISKSGDYVLTGSTKRSSVIIKSGIKVNLWVQNVSIELDHLRSEGLYPIIIEKSASVNMIVKGNNLISNQCKGNGIKVESGAKLVVSNKSSGTITIEGAKNGSAMDGTGSITIAGGTVNAYGGMYGAGVGNLKNPKGTKLTITGGNVTIRGGVGNQIAGTDEINYYRGNYETTSNYDVCVESFIITGGQVNVETYKNTPMNAKGVRVYRQIFNSKTGKIKSILVDGITYGCSGMSCKGYLSIFVPYKVSVPTKITYTDGSVQSLKQGSIWNLQGDSWNFKEELNLNKGAIELFEHGFIYNNHVYEKAAWENKPLIITGWTNRNQIIINSGKHLLEINKVNINFGERKQTFMMLCPNTEVSVIIKGENSITTGSNSHSFFVGNDAVLNLIGDQNDTKLKLTNTNSTGSIITGRGSICQYGGRCSLVSSKNGIGMNLGDYGTFDLLSGEFSGTSEGLRTIAGESEMSIHIHNGEFSVDTIGYEDQSNEEIADNSTFIMTGGNITSTGRMIFGKILIYDGDLKAHLLGAGSGSQYTQYSGTVEMDRFITDYEGLEGFENPNESVLTKSLMENANIYGGMMTETMKVTMEELRKIVFGRC